MKTFSKLAISALALTTVFATNSANAATADATAVVFVPVLIGPTAGGNALSFGVFAAGAGGTVVVPSTGVPSATGGVSVSSAGAPADFTATGIANNDILITLDSTVTLNSGANSMTASLEHNAPSALGADGSADLQVGGTLTVASGQAPGAYVGTYNVNITY